MQKKLIALAVAAAFSAPAFADVTMYGVADAAVVNVSRDGVRSDMIAVSGGLAQSRLGAKAVQDLDNGMKAVVVLEYGLDIQRNDGVGATGNILSTTVARQQMLAVAGGFGTFATGYLQTTGYDWAVKFDPTAGSLVSPLQSMTTHSGGALAVGGGTNFLIGSAALGARAPRALAYISPEMSGVTVAVNYSTDTGLNPGSAGVGNLTVATGAAEVKTAATLLSATYNGGPLSVGAVYATSSSVVAAFELTDMALGASYDLGAAKLFATYQTTKNAVAGAQSDKAMSFSAVAPVGPGAVVFSYAKSTLGTTTAAANSNGSGYTVGWLQGLSKATTLYATLTKVSNDSANSLYGVANNALAPATNGGSATMIALGLNQKF
jgi:predicted porin